MIANADSNLICENHIMSAPPKHGWIKDRLKAIGRAQSDLARAMGVDPAAVTYLIKGTRQIKSGEIPTISRVLGMSESDVVSLLNGGELDRSDIKEKLDDDALRSALSEVESYLSDQGITLPTETKVELVLAAYDLAKKHGSVGEDVIRQLIRMAS